MAEGILTDLNELENKLGRKTPESLLKWMRDAEDNRRSGVLDRENNDSSFSNSLSDQISNLKQELRQLRSADVRILRQLVAVHEGIETMRWLMEDRGPISSHGNSFTGSLSSLTEEENEDVVISCRERPALSSPPYLGEVSSDKTADQNPPPTHCDSSPHFSPSNSKVQAQSPKAAESLVGSTTQKQARMRNITNGAQTIRNALLRCSRTRKPLKSESSLTWSRVSGEKNSIQPTEGRSADGEKVPTDYSTQWFLRGTNDDVTLL